MDSAQLHSFELSFPTSSSHSDTTEPTYYSLRQCWPCSTLLTRLWQSLILSCLNAATSAKMFETRFRVLHQNNTNHYYYSASKSCRNGCCKDWGRDVVSEVVYASFTNYNFFACLQGNSLDLMLPAMILRGGIWEFTVIWLETNQISAFVAMRTFWPSMRKTAILCRMLVWGNSRPRWWLAIFTFGTDQ